VASSTPSLLTVSKKKSPTASFSRSRVGVMGIRVNEGRGQM
jgi:hypothetical protein